MGFAAVILFVFAWLHHAEFPPGGRRFLSALAITAGFAVLAWFAGGVNFSGAIAGSAVAFIMAVRDLRMFLALLIVFAVTLIATRVGYARKQQLRTAEPPGGRTAAQAMANLGIAALVVAIAGAGWPVLASHGAAGKFVAVKTQPDYFVTVAQLSATRCVAGGVRTQSRT